MTPEEQFTKIRNTLETISENAARHETWLEQHESALERHERAIRDLIVVSRTVLTSIQEVHDVQRKDREDWSARAKATDEKLNMLITTVDRIVRERNGQ